MKYDDSARANESRDAFQHRRRVSIEHENVAADGGVERLREFQPVQISVTKRNVADFERLHAGPRGGDGGGRPIDAHDLAAVADQFRRQQRGVAPSAADVQYPHALL